MNTAPIRVGALAGLACLTMAGLACLTMATLAPPAHAQLIAGPGLNGKPQAAKPAPTPPPALPGAQSNSDRVTPAEKSAADLPPTEALFDAINRGDIASARDAISRGADLNGRNLLGMSPMELSVDLGRNNISFLLLSLRGTEGGPRPGAVAQSAGFKAASAAPPKSSAPPISSSRRAERRVPTAVREAAAPVTKTPRLFAGDGGAPIPSAGFLGFDASR